MSERILITGASGLLGAALGLGLARAEHNVLGIRRSHPRSLPFPETCLDLLKFSELDALFAGFRPTVVIHAAALSRVLGCERQPAEARLQNVKTTAQLVQWSHAYNAYFLFVSTDQVFDGQRGRFAETDLPAPTHVYGETKRDAEDVVAGFPATLILRSNNIVGKNSGWGRSFTDGLLDQLLNHRQVSLFSDQYRSPIHIATMVEVISNCVKQRLTGILHAGGPERLSRFETGLALTRSYGLPLTLLDGAPMSSHPEAATLHRDGSFDTATLHSLFPELASQRIDEGFTRDASAQ